jgi:hypothetical protein
VLVPGIDQPLVEPPGGLLRAHPRDYSERSLAGSHWLLGSRRMTGLDEKRQPSKTATAQ